VVQARSWIDFRKLRQDLRFEDVLEHFKVEMKIRNGKASGFCPLPNHRGEKRSPSFSANLAKRIFQCFGCSARGNVLDFAILMRGLNPRRGGDVHQVALELQSMLEGDRPEYRSEESFDGVTADRRARSESPKPDVLVNVPLDFELQELDPTHPYLLERGFLPETIEFFSLGFCSRGAFKNRVAIPLHNLQGELVGYAGRITDENLINADCPKYKFPSTRERKGKLLEFRKRLLVYNAHRLKNVPVDELVVVEGFPSVWHLHQLQHPHVVALMGADCSPEQGEIIKSLVKPFGRVWLMSDGDEAGKRCVISLLRELVPHRFVKWLKLHNGKQPTDLGPEELRELFLLGGVKVKRRSGSSGKPRVANLSTDSNAKPEMAAQK
jgi:DNA primase